jgi:type I restriction enzyme, S subunit
MSNWQKVRLGEVCETNVNTLSAKDKYEFIYYLDTGNITNNVIDNVQKLIVGKDNLPSRAKRKVIANDIVFSTVRPNQRHFGIISNPLDKMVVSTGFTTISADANKVAPRFIYYYISQKDVIDGLQSIAEQSVSTYPSIKPSDIEALEFLLPPLAEQERIGGILGALDDKIECNNRINRNLEEQAQALFRRWFVDFEFPDPNNAGKPYRSSGGIFLDSELGEIPQGWRVGKLEDIGTVVGGGTPSKAKDEYFTSNGIAWITPKDLSVCKNKFISKGEIDITDNGYNNSSTKLMPRGTVLFSSRAPIGYIAISQNEISTNQGFKSVIPNSSIGTPFVYYFLQFNTELIESKSSGSTFKEASGGLMKSLDIVIPDANILNMFSGLCNDFFTQQEKLEQQNQTLVQLRDTLLPKLMNNEI